MFAVYSIFLTLLLFLPLPLLDPESTQLRSSLQTSSSISLEWDAPSAGNYDGYKIRYADLAGDVGRTPSPTTRSRNDPREFVLRGLDPATSYTVTINVFSQFGDLIKESIPAALTVNTGETSG